MKMKKTLAIVLALVLCLGALTACGSKKDSGDKTITVAASPTPHAEILKVAGDVLAKDGWELKVTEYADYVVPNNVVEDGECDANYFQHQPYLDTFNAENGTHLVSVAAIHYEPFGIYAGKVSAIADLKDGDEIDIPNDGSNETRALLLLAQEGLIELPADASAEKGVTTLDIVDAKGHDVQALQADTVPAQLANSNEGTVAVINGNYALQAGLHSEDALAVEDASGDAAQTYANVVAVRAADADSDKTKALVEALQSDAVKEYIESTYNGAVEPMF